MIITAVWSNWGIKSCVSCPYPMQVSIPPPEFARPSVPTFCDRCGGWFAYKEPETVRPLLELFTVVNSRWVRRQQQKAYLSTRCRR